jgi:hypothetical protein
MPQGIQQPPVNPGMLQAIVGALRQKAGMGAQQTPGPATGLQNGYREYAMSAMEQGQEPVPIEQWMQQQTAATPR